jgi:hypothetical protein
VGSNAGPLVLHPLGSAMTARCRSLRQEGSRGIFPVVACPTPNLGSGAHAAGISEAKGAPALGMLGSTPSGRARGA